MQTIWQQKLQQTHQSVLFLDHTNRSNPYSNNNNTNTTTVGGAAGSMDIKKKQTNELFLNSHQLAERTKMLSLSLVLNK